MQKTSLKQRIANRLGWAANKLDPTRQLYSIATVMLTAREKAVNETEAAGYKLGAERLIAAAAAELQRTRKHLLNLAQLTKRRIGMMRKIAASVNHISAGEKLERLAGDIEQDCAVYTSIGETDALPGEPR